MTVTMNTLAVCAALAGTSSAFVAPSSVPSVRTTTHMSAKPGAAVAAVAAAGLLLQGAFIAPAPADAAAYDAAPATRIVRSVRLEQGAGATSSLFLADRGVAFPEGVAAAKEGVRKNIDLARETVDATRVEAADRIGVPGTNSAETGGGTPSKLNPQGFPSAKEGVQIAQKGVEQNLARAKDAVGDARRGVTTRDGAVDQVMSQAGLSAAPFGKLGQAGADKIANIGK